MIRANWFARVALRIARATMCVCVCVYRASKWHYRHRKMIFEVIWHCVADTDTDKTYFGIIFLLRRFRGSCSLQLRHGGGGGGGTQQIKIISEIISRSQQIQIQINTIFEVFLRRYHFGRTVQTHPGACAAKNDSPLSCGNF